MLNAGCGRSWRLVSGVIVAHNRREGHTLDFSLSSAVSLFLESEIHHFCLSLPVALQQPAVRSSEPTLHRSVLPRDPSYNLCQS